MALLAAVLAGRLVAQGQVSLVVFVLVFGLVAVLMLVNPRAAIVTIILGVFSFDYAVSQGILPVMGRWTLDGLILLLFSRVILYKRRTTGLFFRSPIAKLLVIWVATVVLSAAANASPVVQLVLGLRPYVRFVLLYFCLLEFDWDEAFLAKCVRLMTLLFVAQVPISFAQRLLRLDPDYVSGTLPGTGTISVCAIGFFAGLTAYAVFAHRTRLLVPAAACLLLPVFAVARAFVIVTPLVVMYIIVRLLRRGARWNMVVVALSLGLIIANWGLLQGRPAYGSASAIDVLMNPRIFLPELWTEPYRAGQYVNVGRLAGLYLTMARISQSWRSLLFGFGPAVAQGSRFVSLRSAAYESLYWLGSRASQAPTSLAEWGVLGTLTFASIYVVNWFLSERFYRLAADPFWKAVAFGYSVFVAVALLSVVYTAPWGGTSTAFLFWFVGGVLQRIASERDIGETVDIASAASELKVTG